MYKLSFISKITKVGCSVALMVILMVKMKDLVMVWFPGGMLIMKQSCACAVDLSVTLSNASTKQLSPVHIRSVTVLLWQVELTAGSKREQVNINSKGLWIILTVTEMILLVSIVVNSYLARARSSCSVAS